MSEKITQVSFDELHEIIGAVASEDSYNRWIKDGAIRVCDIWDVFTRVPNMLIVDWRTSSEEIIDGLSQLAPDLVLDPDIEYEDLYVAIHHYNQKQAERRILLFGMDWGESDSVQLISVDANVAAKIFGNVELAELFMVL